jgi:hypothetical protein
MLIDQEGQVIATAQVTEQDRIFFGRIDPSPMPVPLRRLFEEYGEIVDTQTFSLLDEIEEKIENFHLVEISLVAHLSTLSNLSIKLYSRFFRFLTVFC